MGKYRNEWILLAALALLIGGVIYRYTMQSRLEQATTQAAQTRQQVEEIQVLKKVWSTQGLKGKVAQLRSVVPASKVHSFQQKKQELNAEWSDLNGQQLNAVTTRIASLPLRIESMTIERSGDNYTVRCRCTW